MARIRFHPDFIPFTNGEHEIQLDAGDYKTCIKKILLLYPDLNKEQLTSYMVTIDGVIIQRPFLDKLNQNSELVFVKKISSG